MAAISAILGFLKPWRSAMGLYKCFVSRKICGICEMIRNDLDNQDTRLDSLLINRKILKQMYPMVKMKYIDLCLKKMREEGDIFTDQFGQDRYKRRIP